MKLVQHTPLQKNAFRVHPKTNFRLYSFFEGFYFQGLVTVVRNACTVKLKGELLNDF